VIDVNRFPAQPKCTLCYDRMKVGSSRHAPRRWPSPSTSVQNATQEDGAPAGQLERRPARRGLSSRRRRRCSAAQLVYLLVDKPEVYGLPPDPKLPSRNLKPSALWSTLGAVALAILGVFSFRERGGRDV
jgi:formate dehydrogenase iron-sulfur subunit